MAEKRKKILFTITKSNLGGAQRYVYDLATELPKDRYETVVALGGNGPLKERLEAAGIRVVAVPEWQRNIAFARDIRSFFTLRRILAAEKPDVVHANSSKAGGVTALAARMSGVPNIIFTAHGWPFNDPVSSLNKFIRWKFSWLTALLAHKVIVVSLQNLEQARRMPFIARKAYLIYNGIPPLSPRTGARAELFEKLSLPSQNVNGILLVGAVGDLNENKNHESAVRALAEARLAFRTPDMRLCIIGEGKAREKLTELIRTLRLEDAVYLPGALPAPLYLSGFDVLVMPSKKEGLPYTLLEAGLVGLPVIASRVGGIPEIITDEQNGILVEPDDDKATAKALCDLAENPSKRHVLGAMLKETIETKFSFERMLAETEKLYG